MTSLLRADDWNDGFFDYSTLVLRGTGPFTGAFTGAPPASGAPTEDQLPVGGVYPTFAVAGAGWAFCALEGDEEPLVRVEVWDGEPVDDAAGWDDVMETPLHVASGRVGPDTLIPGDDTGRVSVELARPGLNLLRVCRRLAGGDDQAPELQWRFQFWPATGEPLPRHVRRGRPFVRAPEGDTDSRLAADLLAVVWWSPSRETTTTVAELASRLLAPADLVVRAIAHARQERLLDAADVPDDVDAPIRLAIATPFGEQELWEDDEDGGFDGAYEQWRPTPDRLPAAAAPLGRPPRAVVVGQFGALVAWRDRTAVTLAKLGSRPWRVVETTVGIVGTDVDAAVTRDGGRVPLPMRLGMQLVASADGRHVATVEARMARRRPMEELLHWLDLDTGRRVTAPLDPAHAYYLVGLARGRVYVTVRDEVLHTVVWTPDAGVEDLGVVVEQVDPVSGTTVHYDADRTVVVTRPDATTHRLAVEGPAVIAPGGDVVCAVGRSVTIVDLAAPDDPSRVDLPADVSVKWSAWEDDDHLLLPVSSYDRGRAGADALRCHVRTGAVERLDLEAGGAVPLGEFAFVAPVLRPAPGRAAASGDGSP